MATTSGPHWQQSSYEEKVLYPTRDQGPIASVTPRGLPNVDAALVMRDTVFGAIAVLPGVGARR